VNLDVVSQLPKERVVVQLPPGRIVLPRLVLTEAGSEVSVGIWIVGIPVLDALSNAVPLWASSP
jgi:hypothetical protein